MRTHLAILSAVSFAGLPLCAQAPAAGPIAAQPAAETKPKTERVVVREYDATRSTALFAACDSNGDDRMDIFEARAAMESTGSPTEIQWYRRLDQDRDGYLSWPEFDRFYRDLVQSGNSLQLTLARGLKASTEVTAPLADATLADTIKLFDKNQDQKLDTEEAQAMLRSLGAPPQALGMLQLLDKDRDGKFDEADLAPHWNALQKSGALQKGGKEPGSQALLALDLDANGSVSAQELARALRRIDPQLERWAPQILAAADKDKDGVLRGPELAALEKEGLQAMVERGARR